MKTDDTSSKIRNYPRVYADLAGHDNVTNQSIGAMNMLKRDRFELLSAYLDGEVTASERHQVEDWLANDPDVQRLYARLLKLRQGLQTMPIPSAQQTVEQTLEHVYQRLHRRSRRQAALWGGGAIAAAFIGTLTVVLPSLQSVQVARTPQSANTAIEPLMVALNNPVVEIPQPKLGSPAKPNQSLGLPQQHKDFN